MALMLGVGVLAVALIVVPTQVQVGRARAQWAADAAALAAAAELDSPNDIGAARRAGRELAQANGAVAISVRFVGGTGEIDQDQETSGSGALIPLSGTVIVDLELEGHSATAAAARYASTRS